MRIALLIVVQCQLVDGNFFIRDYRAGCLRSWRRHAHAGRKASRGNEMTFLNDELH